MEEINHLIKANHLEMFAIETQVPHISRWMMLFDVVSADALASTCSRTSTDATLPMMTSSNGNIWNSPVPVNSPHKGQWRGALVFSLICVWINGWVNNRDAGDLRRHRGHYDVIVMLDWPCTFCLCDSMKRISFLYDTTVSTGPYQNLSLYLVSVSFCYSHQTPSLYFIKYFIFYVWYVYQFYFFCSESSYFLWRGTMYFLSCTSIVWNRDNHSTFVCYCVMINA